MLKRLMSERAALWTQFEAAGGRGVDLAEEIDALDRRIRRLKVRRASRLAREVVRCEGRGEMELCETCAVKASRIVDLLAD